MDVLYYMSEFNPLAFICASRRCHELCMSAELSLPHNYRAGMSGFRCAGTGFGLVLRNCELRGSFRDCHLTECRLHNLYIKPCIYHNCTFTECVAVNTRLQVHGGSIVRCHFLFSFCAIMNTGTLVIDDCVFRGNNVSVLTNRGGHTTIRNCESVDNHQFGITTGITVVENDDALPIFAHRGGVVPPVSYI